MRCAQRPGPMGYWGKKFKVFIIRDGKLIVQTWIQHLPTRSFQALEAHVNEIKTGLISPDAEVLLDEKEVSIDEYSVLLKGPFAREEDESIVVGPNL
jgi:hypothetical protein